MIFTGTGQASDGFFVLGNAMIPSYLLDGPRPVLFESGFSCLGPAYERDARRFLGQGRPELLFLTHAHFDHCGSAAYLQRAFPGLRIAASARAGQILTRPNALKLITELNADAARTAGRWNPDLARGEAFQPFDLDLVLKDGDRVALGGGLSVQVLATPGHTWDLLSYYIPERKILIATEAAGCPDAVGGIVTEFLVDYQVYLDSLRRLAGLEVEVFCPGHRSVYLGQEAGRYLRASLEAAQEYKAWVDGLLLANDGDVERVMALIRAQEYDPRPEPKQTEAAYLLNLEVRVRHLARRLAESGASEQSG